MHFPIPLLLSANNLCKQFGLRSSWTERKVSSGSQLFDTLMVIPERIFEKVNFEKKSANNKKSQKNSQYAKTQLSG